ncbi:MAG: SIR2 family protein [Ruminiclostridium sp.]|uniref:SIR2 family protein n=1 Tax=Ruminococcus sp. TaxID=41978 RepID=UPI0025D01C97|nr:SIR2 family protein [Ruminococcus sp.]MBR1432259.1 SIR2 family protein [Ruminococcus sp.]MBR1831079.1 SIR2 family protein [Ruminiclostridium sp.]
MLTAADALDIMKSLLSMNKLSIFAGSGISVDSGLPTWDGFIDKYIEICEILNRSLSDSMRFTDIIDDAKKNKKKDKELIPTISALKEKIKECKKRGVNTDFCDDKLNELFYSADPNDNHRFIVGTDYHHIITTNYDSLLERAAEEAGYYDLLTRSYSYTEQQNLSIAIYSGKTAIIHAHGKITDIKLDQFVMTNDDYLSIMRHNPGFRLIINSIFLTSSVLFYGYGGSDPHFEEIINDLNMTLNWDNEGEDLPRCYIMLLTDKVTPIREFLNDKHRVEIINFDDYDQMKSFLEELSNSFPRHK